MASYLGKISALVTANTAPFRAALGESAKDLNRWRSDVNRTLNAAADGNWDRKILTKMQQVRQAIAAAQVGDKLNFRLDESQIRRIEQMYSAIEQIAKPLEKVRNQFEGLSTSVQAKFLPALEAVQREALLMRDAIEAGAKIGQVEFDRLDQKVKNVAASMKMLEDIGGLRGRLVTGDELRFRAPGVNTALSRAAELQARSQKAFGADDTRNLPLFQLQGRLAGQLEAIRANILSKQDRGLNADKQIRQEQTIQAQLERTNRILEKRITLQEQANEQSRAGAMTSLPGDYFKSRLTLLPNDYFQKRQENEIKSLISREQKSKQIETAIASAESARARSELDALIGRERRAKQIETTIAAAESARERAELDSLISRERRAKQIETTIAAAESARERAELDSLISRERRAKQIETTIAAAESARERAELDAIISRERRAKQIETTIAAAESARERAELDAIISRERRAKQIEATIAAAESARERTELDSLINRERRARRADSAASAIAAQVRNDIAGVADAGAMTVLPPGYLERAGVIQRLRERGQRATEASAGFRDTQFYDVAFESRLRDESTAIRSLGADLARLGVQAGGPTAQAFNRLSEEAEQFTRDGTIGTRQARQELERLRNVAIDTAVRVRDITPAQAATLRRNTGDISRGGTDKFSLGIQQAAFAVEDFFSVTGGLDQRIRAAGNNISQLGFILGSTTGLFAGIGVTIAAQAIAPLLKLTQVGRDLNDWLESGRNKADSFRDSIAAQKQAVDDLSASFGRLAASIDNASTSSFGRQAKDSRAQIVSIAEGLRNVRERQLFSSDAGVLTADARVKAAENRLGRATTVEEARTARQELEAATQEQRAARERAVVRARQPVDVAAVRRRAEADIEAARVRAEEFRRATLAEGGDAVSAQMGAEEIINEAKQRAAAQIAAAENAAVFQARQRGVDRTTARLGGLLVGGNRVAELAQGMAGQVGPGEITRRLDEVGRIREELARTIDQVVKDGFDPAVFEQVLINANKMQLALLGAASAMQEFIGISDRIKQTVSADVGSLEQRAEQARRAAVIGIPGAAAEAVAAGDTAAEARRLRQRADDAVDIARRRIEQGVLAGDFTRLGQIETALQAQGISVDERERLMAERRAIRDRVAATMEGDPNLAAARALQADATRMAEFAAAADRGRELAMTPGQRAARDLRQQLGDVNAFFGQRAEDGGGLVDVAARNEAMQRVFRDAAEQVAPMFAQFRDEVMTARLQGPSRAALNMVDVATMEGQRELNRLLRGDDQARDVNLAELQKQTTALEELVTIARDMNVNVAD